MRGSATPAAAGVFICALTLLAGCAATGPSGVPVAPAPGLPAAVEIADAPFYHPGADSEEVRYLLERRKALGGCIPKRLVRSKPLPAAAPKSFTEFDGGTPEGQAVSTTMVPAPFSTTTLPVSRAAACAWPRRSA